MSVRERERITCKGSREGRYCPAQGANTRRRARVGSGRESVCVCERESPVKDLKKVDITQHQQPQLVEESSSRESA